MPEFPPSRHRSLLPVPVPYRLDLLRAAAAIAAAHRGYLAATGGTSSNHSAVGSLAVLFIQFLRLPERILSLPAYLVVPRSGLIAGVLSLRLKRVQQLSHLRLDPPSCRSDALARPTFPPRRNRNPDDIWLVYGLISSIWRA